MGTQITGGVDTHLDVHVAAALDDHGGLLGDRVVRDDTGRLSRARGLARCRSVRSWWSVSKGTGSYGAGLTRHLHGRGDQRGRGRSTEPATTSPGREVRHARRGERSSSRVRGRRARRAEDPRRQRRSDPRAAIGPHQRHAGTEPGR